MWELDHKESWAPKNWCFWTVVLEKILESPLDCKEIQPVHPKGNQSWIFIGGTDAKAEAPILWPPDVKNWLIGKDPDAGKDWRQEEKGRTEDEMVGWHHQFDGHEFEQAPGVGLSCCRPWGHKELDMTEWLSWTEILESLRFQIDSCCYHRKAFIVSVHRIVFSSADCDGSDFFFVPFQWVGVEVPGRAVVVSIVCFCALWRCWHTQFLNAAVEDAVPFMVKPRRQATLGRELALVSMGFLKVAWKGEKHSFWGSWAANQNVSLAEYVLGM